MADRLRNIVDTMESLKGDFEKLEDVLDNIRQIIGLLEESEQVIESVLYTKTVNEGQQKMFFETETPTEAVRKFFKQSRGVTLEPRTIVDLLNEMIKEGRLRVKPGRSPGRFVHSILHNLVKQGFIIRADTEIYADDGSVSKSTPQYLLNEWSE